MLWNVVRAVRHSMEEGKKNVKTGPQISILFHILGPTVFCHFVWAKEYE